MTKIAAFVCLLFGFGFFFNTLKAANCEVSRYATTIQIVNNRIIQTDTVIIRINNRGGEVYSDISINYYRNNPLQNLDAWIADKNGTIIRHLKNREITESNSFSNDFYSDYFSKSFTLKHTDYPYYIAYTYQTTEKQFLTVAHWHPVIGLDVPTFDASLTFIQPEEFKVNIIQNQVNNPQIVSSTGIITHRWHATYDGLIRKENFCPDPWDFVPGVVIIPLEFSYGLQGSMESWQSFGQWQASLMNRMDELPESEKRIVDSKIKKITDKREIVRVLYHYLQDHTRYINVNIGIGGLKPYPASYVAQNKFGDCKALSVYMKALLKHAGITSYYVLVNAGLSPGRFYRDIPFQQFNHAMVAVPIGNDTLWLENTDNSLPFGYSGVFTQNRLGLLIDGGNSRLVRIPALSRYEVTSGRKFNFTVAEDGGTRVDAVFTFRGAEFEGANNIMMTANGDDQNEVIHEYLPFRVFDLLDWKMIRRNRDDRSVTLRVSAEINQIVNPVDDQYYFSFQPAPIPDFESPSIRRLPLQISYPLSSNDTLIYRLPGGKTVIEKPADKLIENKFGKYSFTISVENNTLVIYRQFTLNAIHIETSEYQEFFNFIAAIKTHEKLKILFQ